MIKRLMAKYSGIKITLIAIAITLFSTAIGVTGHANGWVYDLFNQFSPLSEKPHVSVVLVTASPEQAYRDDTLWRVAVENLFAAGARGVAFSFQPKGLSESFFHELTSNERVVIARTLSRDPTSDDFTLLEPWVYPSESESNRWGSVHLSVDGDGVYRSHKLSTTGYDTFEWVVATRLSTEFSSSQDSNFDYMINFLAGRDSLPRVSVERVVERGVVPELVENKIVLIGLDDPAQQIGLPTPLGDGEKSLSLLEFYGFGIDSLVNSSYISTTPTWLVILLLLFIAFLSLIILQWGGILAAMRIAVILLVVYLATAALALWFFHFWLPLAEILLLQVVVYVLVQRSQAINQTEQIYKMVAKRSSQLSMEGMQSSFFATEEHWSRVITLVNQLLDLNRLIFLERVPGDHRVREVKALNCSLDDIGEMRRDYLRTPYSTAIELHAPLRLEKSYLADMGDDEYQYLSPLIFAGEVLGFWAFSVDKVKLELIANFEQRIDEFSQQIAELLYHRQQWKQKIVDEQRVFSKYLRLEGGDQISRSLAQVLALMDKRLQSFEDVFSGMGTAAVLYDLFGSVLQINAEMTRLMQEVDLAAYDMTALDLIVNLTGVSLDEGRRYLRTVIVDQEEEVLSVTPVNAKKEQFVLSLRPVFRQSKVELTGDDILPFETVGILLELISASAVRRLS